MKTQEMNEPESAKKSLIDELIENPGLFRTPDMEEYLMFPSNKAKEILDSVIESMFADEEEQKMSDIDE